jgi:hypothetical protein
MIRVHLEFAEPQYVSEAKAKDFIVVHFNDSKYWQTVKDGTEVQANYTL